MLVVDDEPTVRTFLARVIERSNLEVVQASCVSEALALVATRGFLIALVDKNLPDGSGIEVMEALHQRDAQVPVVMMTAFLDAGSAVAAMRAGAVDVLSKPFEFRALRERLEGLLERARARAERQRLDALLFHADRLATLGTLAASVAHEFSTPLAVVLANLDFLLETLRGRDDVGALVDAATDAREAARRMRTIAGDLKGYGRRELGDARAVDLPTVVARAVALAEHATRNRLTVTVEVQPTPPVQGWATRFEQVLVNLLVNAAQAMPPERQDGVARVTLGATGEGWASLEVADNGPGVPEALRVRLFTPFFTTRGDSGGTGLGLSVVADIVRAVGGRVECLTTPGGGATFRVLLPPMPTTQAPSPGGDASGGHGD